MASSTLNLYMALVENDDHMENNYKYRAKQLAKLICEEYESNQLHHIDELIKCTGFWIVDATLVDIKKYTTYENVRARIDKYFNNINNKNNETTDRNNNNDDNNKDNDKNDKNSSNEIKNIGNKSNQLIDNKQITDN